MAFVTGLTFWLGNAVVLGVGMAYAPEAAGTFNLSSPGINRTIALALAVIAIYLLWLIHERPSSDMSGWDRRCQHALTLVQIAIGILDLGLAALAMYVLPAVHAPVVYPARGDRDVRRGRVAGVLSHAPGSLGVFDAAMLVALPGCEKEQLLASLLIFRCLYFVVPFVSPFCCSESTS